jgi:glycosyltransferase involved in cell wall biosynthesis
VAQHRTHVLFFVAQLGGGGAESHILRLANGLDPTLFKVEVATVRKGGSFEAKLAPGIDLIHLTEYPVSSSTLGTLVPAVPRLRALLETRTPHVLCAALEHAALAAMIAHARLSTRLVLCVQNNPDRMYPSKVRPLDVGMRMAFRHLYHRADAVVALSAGVAEALRHLDPRMSSRLRVIPNAALDQDVLAGAHTPAPREGLRPGERLLVACGRLTEQKGYPDLLRALVRVREQQPARLWVLGEGPDRPQLERLRSQLGLDDVVEFLGFCANPYARMAAADVFVLSSLWEGFGNVIVEAMAAGAPVVVTDCPYGPAEIVEPGTSGLLSPVADPAALAQNILRVLQDDSLRTRLIRGGQERAKAFDAQVVAKAYGDVFASVA